MVLGPGPYEIEFSAAGFVVRRVVRDYVRFIFMNGFTVLLRTVMYIFIYLLGRDNKAKKEPHT